MKEPYLEKRVRRLVGKAIHEYRLLEDGDRVLVALSGGKDSVVLLKVLCDRLRYVPISYELKVLTVDLGFGGLDTDGLREFVEAQGCEFILKRTEIGPRAHRAGGSETPCFLCSRWRRKVFFETASELGCNKLALGHNRDDIIETFLMNVLYCGEISTMVPRQELFGGRLTVIRPLALLDEEKIRAYLKLHRLPEFQDRCPTREGTKRREIKHLIGQLHRMDKRIKGNIFHALSNVRLEYLLDGRRHG
ncbi:MAG: tRNA 2-thiocytidine(32) synthetase TtcA [Deltaproteobacteria bacterium]|nr:MAG: tRNA 2-thiocytidine(32) synthetase TtcA [Deltaproteobacteria bacterium]RLA98862.1 MAG: tRNA 2-thiocytidine(32) synthetase TtcA [Deltaproteobacteria bacterium]